VLVLAGPVRGAIGSDNEGSETCQQYDVAALLQGTVGVQRVAEVLSPRAQDTGSNMPPIVMPPTGNSMPPSGGSAPPTAMPPTGNGMRPTGGTGNKPTVFQPGRSTNTDASAGEDVSINFGGPKRDDNPTGSMVYRPEAVHSEVCDGSKPCTTCASKSKCWHGTSPNALQISVPLGDTKTYVATMFASCSSGKGYWQVYVEEILNAKMNVYLNGKDLVHTGGVGELKEYKIPGDKIGKKAQITISLSHSQNSAINSGVAFAKLVVFAMADKYVDTCMDRTFCLKKLGDESDAAFELRNSNRRQYECLTGKPASNLVKVCTKWRGCFASQKNGNHEKELLKLLSAVFSKKSALLEVSSPLLAGDKKGCLDPAAQDAEAVECECLDGMVKACKAAGITDHEKCFLGELCKSVKVCDSWKQDNCPNALLIATSLSQRANQNRSALNAETKQRSKVSTHAANNDGLADGLDGTMQGKCAEQ